MTLDDKHINYLKLVFRISKPEYPTLDYRHLSILHHLKDVQQSTLTDFDKEAIVFLQELRIISMSHRSEIGPVYEVTDDARYVLFDFDLSPFAPKKETA